MLNENAKKWVAALRSGRYRQVKGYLRKGNSYCCLGVACELAVAAGVIDPAGVSAAKGDNGTFLYAGNSIDLPLKVQEWLGLSSSIGFYDNGDHDSLVMANDSGCRFPRIADIIESEPEGLFKKA